MLRSSNWFRTFPFHGKAYGFESRTEYKSISRGRLEMAPAGSHKPNYEGSNPSPATKGLLVQLARTSDLHSEGHRFDSGTVHKKCFLSSVGRASAL